MIRTEILALLACALLTAACGRDGGEQSAKTAQRPTNPDGGGRMVQSRAEADVSKDRVGDPRAVELNDTVLEKNDITVNGDTACALTVRYGEGAEQPVTWRGESCGRLVVRLSSIEDLQRLGQDKKLTEESLEDLARMPGGRAIYIEGSHSSALYPENVVQRVYEVPLAD